jgi:hypothetical protein
MIGENPGLCLNRKSRAGHADDSFRYDSTRKSRAVWLSLASGGVGVLLTARALTPDPSGYGTHTQLGLPGCLLLQLTGLPCPACGLTTCFSLLAHGELRAGFACHPLGAVGFSLLCAAIPACVYAAVRGSGVLETLTRMRAGQCCAAFSCALLAQWLVRVAGALLG